MPKKSNLFDVKSFDPELVYEILVRLQAPGTLNKILRTEEVVRKKLGASKLRTYLNALISENFIAIEDMRFRKQWNKRGPRRQLDTFYKTTEKGQDYLTRYERLMELHWLLDQKNTPDRL